MLIHRQHVLQRQRLEVQTVAGVVVGGDGLGIAVDHDGLVAVFSEGKRRVAAAVVELDSLADAVWPAAQNDDLPACGRRGLVFLVVAAIEVRRVALELRRACVHQLEDRLDAEFRSHPAHLVRAVQLPLRCEPLVGDAHPLGRAQIVRGCRIGADRRNRLDLVGDLLDLVQEPRVHRGEARHLADTHSLLEGVAHIGQPLRMRRHQPLRQAPRFNILGPGLLARLQRAHGLHQRFLEGPPDGHHLAHRLHLRPQPLIRAGKLLELPLGNLHHHVVDGWLEAGRRGLCNVVLYLVQRIADGQPRRDLGDREAGGFTGKRGRARDARVHLDDDHASVVRVYRELHVAAAGLHADLSDAGNSRIAHPLILAVGQRLRRCHRDRVAGMHAHGVEVLDRADDDDVVLEVADHLQLVLLPAQHTLLDQALVHRREVDPVRQNARHLLAVVCDSAARSAQRKAGTNNHRESDLRGKRQPVAHGAHKLRLRQIEADPFHRILEEQPVLGLLDGLQLGPDQLHAISLQHAGVGQLHGKIQRCLPAHGRQ